MWSAYFDDFLCLARESEAKHVDFCVSSIFSLLGWKVSTHKLPPFASICKVLGVQLDLRQSGDSLCLISNTTERVEELIQDIANILSAGALPRVEGERLRGRLQFASTQVFGRKLKWLLKVLSNHVTAGRKSLSKFTGECLVGRSLPHSLTFYTYVDASFNKADFSGIGGLIIDMQGNYLSFFSAWERDD